MLTMIARSAVIHCSQRSCSCRCTPAQRQKVVLNTRAGLAGACFNIFSNKKTYLESVVDQANLDKGVGELAVASQLGQQQYAGNNKV